MSRKAVTERVLPEGWKIMKLGEFGCFKNGINKSKDDFGKGFPFVGLLDVFGQNAISNTPSGLVNVSMKELEAYSLKAGDVLFVRSSVKPEGVGLTCVLLQTLTDTAYSGFLIRFRADQKILDWAFSRYCFYSHRFRKSLLRKSSVSANTNINQQSLEKLELLVPPIPEQQAIAETLQTWDTAIEKTEKLITEKEKQFRWLSRNLLRQESNQSWSAATLQSMARIQKGKQRNRATLQSIGEYPVWNGGITPSGYTSSWNARANTITISEGGNSCGFVNYCKENFWSGGHCYSLLEVHKNIKTEFLYYYLKTNEKIIMQLRVGSGLPNIQRRDIGNFTIFYPDVSEQEHIVKTLNAFHKEIDLLKILARQYRTQKRGLMRKLLTGEWRVK